MSDADSDFWTVEAMLVYGGGFVRALAAAIPLADPNNLGRLRAAFPEYFAGYAELGQRLKAEDKQWPWCDACGSYHSPDNPTCKRKEASRG